jgi:DNA-binding LacI/PurR family transcriptional regulator
MDNIRQKTSMQDIATVLGISKNAVSLALNNRPGISETLRSKVIQTAIDMNYGGYGKLGSTVDKNLVAICVPSAISGSSQFYSTVYWAIEQALGVHGYHTLLTSITREMEEQLELPPVLDERELRGIVVVGILSKEFVRKLATVFGNIVLVDNYYVDLPLNSVVTANSEGGYEATQCLIEHGCRHIGFVGNIARYSAYRERWAGCKLALEHAAIAIDETMVFTDSKLYTPSFTVDAVAAAIAQSSMDAVFCACDRDAIQLIGRLHALGVAIPDRLSVIGFDDIENADIINPPLTTMRVPRRDLGLRAVDLLIDQIEGKMKSRLALSVYPQLIVRNSVRQTQG